ncbi:purple acid phosphatase family protein [Nocardiopsis coralliicola]
MSPTPRSRPRRNAARAAAAACAFAAAAAGTAAPAAAAAEPERVLLSPAADPAAAQTVTWRAAGGPAEAPVLEIAPADDPESVQSIDGDPTGDAGGAFARATASGLAPDTAYRYRVGDAEGGLGPWQEFTTAADSAEPFDFLYFGDIQNDITEGAAPVVRAALAAEPDAEFAVHSGDLIDSANDDGQWGEWYDAFGPEATGGMNHLAVPGNHEYAGLNLSDYWERQFAAAGNGPDSGADLAETVTATDYQGVRFIGLNSNYRTAAPLAPGAWLDEQREWLEQALAEAPGKWTVVAFHHPVFSNSPGRDNGPLRDAWLDTLEEADVDLVLQGHDHSYSRGNLVANQTDDPDVHTGPVYAVTVAGPKMYDVDDANWTGNGAEARVQAADTQTYQAVSVDGDTLDYTARTADGTTVDAFTITDDGSGKRVTDAR